MELVSVRKGADSLESFVILWWPPIRFQEVADVDAREPWPLRAQGRSLSERFERCGVGADRAPDLAGQARGGKRSVDVRAVDVRAVDVRALMNGVLYVLETGCQWRALPKDLPPKSTVHDYLMLWDWDGTLERIHHALYLKTRDLEGCEASPSAGPWPMPPGGSSRSRAPPRPRASRSSSGALVVERTIAWINRCRRLAKACENLNRTALAFIRPASIGLMLRRLTRYCYPS